MAAATATVMAGAAAFQQATTAAASNVLPRLPTALLYDVRIAAVITATFVAEHFLIRLLRVPSTGGMKNPELTPFHVVRCFFYAMVSFATIALHTALTLPDRPAYRHEFPSLLQLCIYFPITLAVQDFYHYFVHRWIHTKACPKWIRKIHLPHHQDIHPTTGMLTTDLFAANPIEYWITILPSLSILYEMWAVLPHANFTGFVFCNWLATIVVGLGHANTEVPLPWVWQSVGYGKTNFHIMHHYDPSKNFSVYSTWMDRLFGTYKPYSDQKAKGHKIAVKATALADDTYAKAE